MAIEGAREGCCSEPVLFNEICNWLGVTTDSQPLLSCELRDEQPAESL